MNEEVAKLIDEAVQRANARQTASWTHMCKRMVEIERERCARICETAPERHDVTCGAAEIAAALAAEIRGQEGLPLKPNDGWGGWQPIETAPKDTPILATDGKVVVVLSRGECAGDDWPDAVGFGGYEWDWDFSGWHSLTHWMPLPKPPSN